MQLVGRPVPSDLGLAPLTMADDDVGVVRRDEALGRRCAGGDQDRGVASCQAGQMIHDRLDGRGAVEDDEPTHGTEFFASLLDEVGELGVADRPPVLDEGRCAIASEQVEVDRRDFAGGPGVLPGRVGRACRGDRHSGTPPVPASPPVSAPEPAPVELRG